LLNWAVDRDAFNEAATEMRARFDANRGVSAAKATRLYEVSYNAELFQKNGLTCNA